MIMAVRGSTLSLLRNHIKLLVFTCVLFVVGIIFGTLVVGALSSEQKLSLFSTTQHFFSAVNDHQLANSTVMTWQAISSNLKLLGLIWILGLSIIGMPVIVAVLFLQGFFIGFTVGFLVDQFASKGLLFSIMAVLPQNLLMTPALILASVAGIVFSTMLVKSRFAGQVGRLSLSNQFLRYTAVILVMGMLMVGAGLMEGYVSPLLMRLITPHL